MTAIIAMATAKSGRPIPAYRRRLGVAAIVLASAMMFSSNKTLADESGVSFWVPGFYGSLAAVPQAAPGWSGATIYWHDSVSAGSDVARAREFQIRGIPANATANVNANVHANLDLCFCDRDLHLCDPGAGRAGLCQLDGSLRRQLHVARGIAHRNTDDTGRHISFLALRQHQ